MSDRIEKFEIRVEDAVLDDLKQRLARTRWTDQIEGSGWDYGTDGAYLKELCEYWREKFDWRSQEAQLNRFEHYRTEIDGQSLHFVHRRSPVEGALPLLLTHGWPGSFWLFHKIIDVLADPESHGGRAEDAFHVVCPSLPGYGFSGPTRESGWDIRRVAEALAALMARLGYARYGAQGGDWGSLATTQLALLDAEHLAGIHLNMVVAGPPAGESEPTQGLTPEELQGLADIGETVYAVVLSVAQGSTGVLMVGFSDSRYAGMDLPMPMERV